MSAPYDKGKEDVKKNAQTHSFSHQIKYTFDMYCTLFLKYTSIGKMNPAYPDSSTLYGGSLHTEKDKEWHYKKGWPADLWHKATAEHIEKMSNIYLALDGMKQASLSHHY